MEEAKHVVVLGAGKSGINSAKLLLRHGVVPVIFDQKEDLDVKKLLERFKDGKPDVLLGSLTEEQIKSFDLCVISPGIPTDAPFVNDIRDAGVPIWGEIELAYRFNKGAVAAITGTNGKTTTTTLVGEIFKAYRENTIVVGNIGTPFTEYADKTDEDTLVAAEISSFQLETTSTFHPHVSAVLNLTPDHLNRHYTFDNYADVKFHISDMQDESDYCVLNYDDPETVNRAAKVKKAKVIFFSRKRELEEGVFIKEGKIIVRENGEDEVLLLMSDIQIPGTHNVENVLAAAAVAHFMGIPSEVIQTVVHNFRGVEHRIEYVRELSGVVYYNDSKGTNPDAAIKAIEAMKSIHERTPGKTLLIGGGYDKGSTYDEWIESFGDEVKYLVLIGATASKISATAKAHNFTQVVIESSLREAVEFCFEHASSGDTVLLSPACASWDMFTGYEERGRMFKEYVNELNA